MLIQIEGIVSMKISSISQSNMDYKSHNKSNNFKPAFKMLEFTPDKFEAFTKLSPNGQKLLLEQVENFKMYEKMILNTYRTPINEAFHVNEKGGLNLYGQVLHNDAKHAYSSDYFTLKAPDEASIKSLGIQYLNKVSEAKSAVDKQISSTAEREKPEIPFSIYDLI